MSKKDIIEQAIREEITGKYSKNNGKITLYLNESMLTLIDMFADYKSKLLVDNQGHRVMSFPKFITWLATMNLTDLEGLMEQAYE